MFKMTAPCHFGLEKILAFEIGRAGGKDIACFDGRVNFSGDMSTLVKANIGCSVAERIGIVIAEFRAETFDDVFDNVKNSAIYEFVGKDDKFPIVKGQSVNSKLSSIPALQRTVKKALVLAMAGHYKTDLTETGVLYPIRFFLHKDKMTVFIDASGEGLHKRGYRAESNAAPIKETLAAGLVDLARVRGGDVISDPFCGSGTILIEAAFKALNIPPCLNRKFISMEWSCVHKNLWNEIREELRFGIKKDAGFSAFGYDNDVNCIRLTSENARKAGVSEYIKTEKRDIKDFVYPENKCKIITNPPYGERLMTEAEIAVIYKDMGQKFLPRGENELYIISGNESFEKNFGYKADKNRKLYNGMLMCRLYYYNRY